MVPSSVGGLHDSHWLTPARQAGYNAGMSDFTSTIASLQRRVEEIAVHL